MQKRILVEIRKSFVNFFVVNHFFAPPPTDITQCNHFSALPQLVGNYSASKHIRCSLSVLIIQRGRAGRKWFVR